TSSSLPSAKLTVRPEAAIARGFSSTPSRFSRRGLEPISVSRSRSRRPSRDSIVFVSSRVFVSHQKRSRPRNLCGNGIWHEPSAVRIQRPHRVAELDRELEGGCVLLEIGDHFVARRVTVGVTGERKAGEAVVAPRRE